MQHEKCCSAMILSFPNSAHNKWNFSKCYIASAQVQRHWIERSYSAKTFTIGRMEFLWGHCIGCCWGKTEFGICHCKNRQIFRIHLWKNWKVKQILTELGKYFKLLLKYFRCVVFIVQLEILHSGLEVQSTLFKPRRFNGSETPISDNMLEGTIQNIICPIGQLMPECHR